MRHRLTLLACALLLAPACATATPGVGVQKIQADVVFGAKVDTAQDTLTPELPPAIPEDLTLLSRDFGVPKAKFLPPLAPAAGPCPDAALNAFPPKEAGFNAEGVPQEGSYRWKRSGTQTLNSLPGFTLPVTGFETRLVRRVTRVNPTTFTYQTVHTELNTNRIITTTWQVKTAPTQQTANTIVGPTVRQGEPDRGLAVIRVDRHNSKGDLLGSFVPRPPVLFLPLPVLPGETFQGQGIDAASGETWRVDGTIKGRQRVDACGDVVDGWGAEGSLTRSGADNFTKYNWIVSTQMGALLTSEFAEGTTPAGTIKATFNLGQVEPKPLPEEAK